jgi:hypothetical protein
MNLTLRKRLKDQTSYFAIIILVTLHVCTLIFIPDCCSRRPGSIKISGFLVTHIPQPPKTTESVVWSNARISAHSTVVCRLQPAGAPSILQGATHPAHARKGTRMGPRPVARWRTAKMAEVAWQQIIPTPFTDVEQVCSQNHDAHAKANSEQGNFSLVEEVELAPCSIENSCLATLRVRLVRVSGPTRPTRCRRAAFGCLHHPQSQALQMQFPPSCLHLQKRQKQPLLQSQARLMQLFLSLMMY